MANEKKYASLESLQVFLNNLKNTFMSYKDVVDTLPNTANEGEVYHVKGTTPKWESLLDNSTASCNIIVSKYNGVEAETRNGGTSGTLIAIGNVPTDYWYGSQPFKMRFSGNNKTSIVEVTHFEYCDVPDGTSYLYASGTASEDITFNIGDAISVDYATEGVYQDALYVYHNGKFVEFFPESANINLSNVTNEALQSKAEEAGLATEVYVDEQISTQIAELVDSAPETLNTLNELAAALGDDPNFATTIATQIGNKAEISHKHTMSDITDYTAPTVDSALSSTSTNPVQNKVLNDEFNAISNAMGALEVAIDNKAESGHSHNAYELEYNTSDDGTSSFITLGDVIESLKSDINYKAPSNHSHNISDMDDYDSVIGGIYGDIGGMWSTFDSKADVNHTHSVSDIDDIDDLVLITVADIDNICGTNVLVQSAEEVSF